MLEQKLNSGEKLVQAILDESGMSVPSAQLIKIIFQKQQEILLALEDVIRSEGHRSQYVDKRLDELLEKIDPEKAEAKRKQPQCDSSAGPRIPSRCLI